MFKKLLIAAMLCFAVAVPKAEAHPAMLAKCVPPVVQATGAGTEHTLPFALQALDVAGAVAAGITIFTAPAWIQETNPLCDWFTCYDNQDRPFVQDDTGIHPLD